MGAVLVAHLLKMSPQAVGGIHHHAAEPTYTKALVSQREVDDLVHVALLLNTSLHKSRRFGHELDQRILILSLGSSSSLLLFFFLLLILVLFSDCFSLLVFVDLLLLSDVFCLPSSRLAPLRVFVSLEAFRVSILVPCLPLPCSFELIASRHL